MGHFISTHILLGSPIVKELYSLLVLALALLTGCGPNETVLTPPVRSSSLGMDTPFITPPIASPPMVDGTLAGLADDAEVIGLVVPSGPRAYSIEALSERMSHVVNDVVDGVPFAVTYCNMSDCARVLTRNDSSDMINLQTGGIGDGKMFVMLNNVMHRQDSEDLPLEDLEFTRTNWGTWFADHADTLVFIGMNPPISDNETQGAEDNSSDDEPAQSL